MKKLFNRKMLFNIYRTKNLNNLKEKINKFDTLDKSDLVTSLDKLYKHLEILDEEQY